MKPLRGDEFVGFDVYWLLELVSVLRMLGLGNWSRVVFWEVAAKEVAESVSANCSLDHTSDPADATTLPLLLLLVTEGTSDS